jgi:hypothetical protein
MSGPPCEMHIIIGPIKRKVNVGHGKNQTPLLLAWKTNEAGAFVGADPQRGI